MTCTNCGSAIDGGFCSACGTPAAPPTGSAPGFQVPTPPVVTPSTRTHNPPPPREAVTLSPPVPAPVPLIVNSPPPNIYAPIPEIRPGTDWRWGYSRWIGITYGPIPVGVIVGILVIIYVKSRHW